MVDDGSIKVGNLEATWDTVVVLTDDNAGESEVTEGGNSIDDGRPGWFTINDEENDEERRGEMTDYTVTELKY